MFNLEQINEEKKKLIKAITEVCNDTKIALNECLEKDIFYIEEAQDMKIPMYDYLNCVLDAIYSLKLKYIVFNAKGVIDSNKGCVSNPETNGHFQYFLYNPFDNNPYSDFSKIDKEGDKDE